MDQTLRDKEIIVNHRLALEEHISWGKSAREILLGMSDGIITTLAFVAGVTGVIHDNHIILLTALAGISAGTISMFFSAYLSMKSQKELFENEIKRETREVDEVPEIERQEIREIYRKKGFKGEDLEMIVDRITSDKDIWVRSMMEEELKLFPEDIGRPFFTASLIGVSYIIGSLIPISPFLLFPPAFALILAIVTTIFVMFGIGAIKARFSHKSWLKSGLENTSVVMAATLLCYVIGKVSGNFLNF